MADAVANFAITTVATAPSPAISGTSLVVAAGKGTLFPAVPFNATVWPVGVAPTSANAEIVRVTGVSTDTFTITRAQESTSARTIVVGDNIAQLITKKAMEDAAAANNWTDDSANTWTYASASTFTVSGDRTSVFTKGTRLRFTQTTVKYGVVVGSSHSTGTTTVTIAVNTDYVLANAAISVNSYSYALTPPGYPEWFYYTPTYTGFSSPPAAGNARFRVNGLTCTVQHQFATGTSNGTGYTVTTPVTAAASMTVLNGRVQNNSALVSGPGLADIAAAASTITCLLNGTTALWTGSGTKGMSFELSYPI